MRGEDRRSGALFSYVDVEARVAAKHPLRAMWRLTNAALAELDQAFSALYVGFGRPSIPPERLLRATPRERPALTPIYGSEDRFVDSDSVGIFDFESHLAAEPLAKRALVNTAAWSA